MVSVDSVNEYEEAKQLGVRTYTLVMKRCWRGKLGPVPYAWSAVRQLSAVQWHAPCFG